jgi:hypothetical protein
MSFWTVFHKKSLNRRGDDSGFYNYLQYIINSPASHYHHIQPRISVYDWLLQGQGN